MLANNLKLILLKLIIIIGLVCGMSDSAQAGFAYWDPFDGGKKLLNPDWAGCMEDSWDVQVVSSSTMFDPKIKVHNRLIFSCFGWEQTTTLSAYGECKFFGAVRVCARITPPGKYGNDYCKDGCSASTTGINKSCAEEPNTGAGTNSSTSTSCPSCANQSIYRICVFEDPMLPADPNDPSSYSMPSHALSQPPPDQSMGDQATSATSDVTTWMEDTGIMVPGVGLYASMIAQEISITADLLNMALELTGLSYINYVSNNAIAEAKPSMWAISSNLDPTGNRGCVDYPIGPSPPPFCSPMVGTVPIVSLANVCQSSPEYEESNSYKQISTSDNTCEIDSSNNESDGSPIYNSFEAPLARLYFSNPMPLCEDAPAASSSPNDHCVNAIDPNTSDKIWLNNKSLLPICTEAITTNCLTFNSGRKTGPSSGGTNSFRTYYNLSNPSCIGSTTTGADEQIIDYAVYPTPSSGNACEVVLAGVHDSNYGDISSGQTIDIIDYIGLKRRFSAVLNTADGDGMDLCITEENQDGTISEVDCVERPHMFQPSVSACLDKTSCYYNNSSVPYEQPRISFNVGNPSQRGIIGVDLALTDGSNPPNTLAPTPFCVLDENATTGAGTNTSNPVPCQVYQARLFSAYVTDSYNKTPDTSSSGDCTVTPYSGGDPYTGGIQYVKGIYCRGATRICLDGYSAPHAQVVAKILYTTSADNGAVTAVISNDVRDRIIPPYVAGQEALGATPVFDEDTNYWYEESTTTRVALGYKNSSGIYLENAACTATPDTYNCTYTCSPDTSCPTSTTPAPVTCLCYGATDDTKNGYSCSNQNCEWAFLVNNTTTSTSYNGYKYTDGNNVTTTYELYDANNRLQYDKRPLNPIELGTCVETQVPYCDAIDESAGGTSANGYASWNQTSVNDTVTGTCVGTMEESSSGPPKRKCVYKDDGTYQANGCPNYAIIWDVVENPCSDTPVPQWWPGEFLANNSNYQGAIFNQFNVNYNYQSTFIPRNRNLDPFYNAKATGSPSSPSKEGWVTTGYNSCKNYGSNISLTGDAKRANMDGDQEMLYLTRAQWQYLWNNNDMTWLLATSSKKAEGVDYANYNGCYVYDLKGNINATIDGITVGMKICKYEDKISFSLVDMLANTAVDYTNNAYIMQSNLIAYDRWNTQKVNSSGLYDSSFVPNTQVTNSNSSDIYTHYVNHGIVVNRTGWNDNFTVPTIASPPFSSPITTPETTSAEYSFIGYYHYDTQSQSWDGHKTTHNYYVDSVEPYPGFDAGTDTSLTKYMSQITGKNSAERKDLVNDDHGQKTDCALSVYRNAINYNKATNYLTYLPLPTKTPSDDAGKGSFISKMYRQTDYNGGNKNNGRRETQCGMEVRLYNYQKGNSAANPNMFLWSTKDSYNVCNY